MNTQILIPLDDMTPENGATSLRPRSQVEIEYPTNVEEYRSNCEYLLFAYQAVWVLKSKVFGQESTVLVKRNYQILSLHPVTVRQILGVILVIKWF